MDITMHKSTGQSLSKLIARIERSHHVFTREALAHIKMLFISQETNGVELEDIRRCFEKLEEDLTPHLMKEEHILFPYIVALENNPGQLPASCFGSVANPIRMMCIEHYGVNALLEQLRELTANYHPRPESYSNIFALYAALAELDHDLVEHIHLEDDVLFPQALELERCSSTYELNPPVPEKTW